MMTASEPKATNPPGIRICNGFPGRDSSWSYSTTSCVFAPTCRARYCDSGIKTTSYLPKKLRWFRYAFRKECSELLNHQYTYLRNYHANASGASPPGPGQMASNSSMSALLNLIFRARRLPVNCSIVRGPMIGAVTTGFASSHAKATSAGFCPFLVQNFSYLSSCPAYFLKSPLVSFSARRPDLSAPTEPANRPLASGL